jgi:hypothetical protein
MKIDCNRFRQYEFQEVEQIDYFMHVCQRGPGGTIDQLGALGFADQDFLSFSLQWEEPCEQNEQI